MADLLIRGGELVDGTGAPRVRADVRVRRDRIAEVGPDLAPDGEREVDASGAVVAPGFIDGHTHYDPSLWWDPSCDPMPGHGVTTVVTGNCSLSLAPLRTEDRTLLADMFGFIEDLPTAALERGVPWSWESFAEYRSAFDSMGAAVNVCSLVGHSALRLFVMGEESFERPASDGERERIAGLLRETLAAGAFGLSTSFIDTDRRRRPVPSRQADDAEFDALARGMREAGRGILEFVPQLGDREHWLADIDRMDRFCRRANVPGTWTQLSTGGRSPTPVSELLEQAERTQREGPGIFPQFTPRPAEIHLSFEATPLFHFQPVWYEIVQAEPGKMRSLLASSDWRARARKEWDSPNYSLFPKEEIEHVRLTRVARPELDSYVGWSLAQLVAARGGHPSDVLADWVLENDLDPGIMLVELSNTDPEAVRALLHDPAIVCAGSDAGAHVQMICGGGDTTLMLERHVRERADLTLEEAVRRLTSEVAYLFGIRDRGQIAPGLAADLVVFSLDELALESTHVVADLPDGGRRLTRPPGGYRATIAAGVITHEAGRCTGENPGRMLDPTAIGVEV
ncbi:MAG: amidohydrolase family protein [Deltaproteobacteria bacterium]|nr:amidohydrolase family protein [Deltaproteobacteria bacterium]